MRNPIAPSLPGLAASGPLARSPRSTGPRASLGALWFVAGLALAMPIGVASAQFVDVAAGESHTLALAADGQVLAWGYNGVGQCDVPALPPGLTFVEVAAGGDRPSLQGLLRLGFSLGRRSDGSIVAWGHNGWGQCDVPALPPGVTYTGVAAGNTHSLALRSDGSVAAWGNNTWGQCDVPALPPGLTYVEISAGGSSDEYIDICFLVDGFPYYYYATYGFSLARRSDGSVVAWGYNGWGQCDVPALPPGLTYAEVSAGADHAVARRSDGSVVAWGANDDGQTDVPALPPGLSYAGLDAGPRNTTAWLSDGSLVEWGIALASPDFVDGIAAPPLPPGTSYIDVDVGGALRFYTIVSGFSCDSDSGAAASAHVVALRSDGTVVAWGDNSSYQVVDPWTDLGGGTAGLAGTPELGGSGTPLEGQLIRLSLPNTPPGALLLGLISLDSTPFSALGGTVHAYPFVAKFQLTAHPVVGGVYLDVPWPAGVPAATEFWFQFVVLDGSVALGLTLSNGLKLRTP
jgi:hypothetical protein